MKVAFAENNVLASGGLEKKKSFSINANAHAFRMLSSGLYSDKIRAVIREIGCNAVDAHIAAGTPERPIRMKIPNSLDGAFYVQDWGPGLSHDDMLELYSSYFTSTKQQSDEFTGAFGLGSKSPFSYIDSFTVVSVFEGVKSTYALFLDNEGSPTISRMATEKAEEDWPHGLRVGFAVKPSDFSEFQTKAWVVCQWFAVTPEMKGIPPIILPKRLQDQPDFMVLEGHVDGLGAVMGGVYYPLSLGELGLSTSSHNHTSAKHVSQFIDLVPGLVLKLPIGTAQVAGSRESLQYDPATIKTLKDRIGDVVMKFAKELYARMDALEALSWDKFVDARHGVHTAAPSLHYYFDTFAKLTGLDDPAIVSRYKNILTHDWLSFPRGVGENTSTRVVTMTNLTQIPSHKYGTHISFLRKTAIVTGEGAWGNLRMKKAVRIDRDYDQLIAVTASGNYKATPAEIAADVEALQKAMHGTVPVIQMADLPLPDDFVATQAKRKSKKKGTTWVPELPKDVKFPTQVGTGIVSKELTDIDPLYMTTIDSNSWGRSATRYRLFEKTEREDRRIDADVWDLMWKQYIELTKTLNVPAKTSYARLSATQVRASNVATLGWKWAYTEVQEWLQRDDVRDALKAEVGKWKPSLPEYVEPNEGIVSAMARRLAAGLPVAQAVKDTLVVAGLWASIKGVADTTVRAKASKATSYAPRSEPQVLETFRNLAANFKIALDKAVKVTDSITIQEMDAVALTKFPGLRYLNVQELVKGLGVADGPSARLLETALT